jgi:hypothetical protein
MFLAASLLVQLFESGATDSFQVVLRAFEESWYLAYHFRFQDQHVNAAKWQAEVGGQWPPPIGELVEFTKARGVPEGAPHVRGSSRHFKSLGLFWKCLKARILFRACASVAIYPETLLPPSGAGSLCGGFLTRASDASWFSWLRFGAGGGYQATLVCLCCP